VNYRTPSEIADVADDVLATIEPGLAPPRSVRSTGVPPRAVPASAGRLEDTVAKVLAEEAGAVGDGRTAVLVPTGRLDELRGRLLGAGDTEGADDTDGSGAATVDLTAPVVVLPVSAAKGLEFDAVIVVEPAELLAESPRGRGDLYVALTRATQRLAVVHAEPLPAMLHKLQNGG
jgi:superfamily I DNA/RNA helicase